MSGTHAHLLILESDCKKIYRIMITPSNKGLFNVLLRLVQPSWRGTFEGTGTILGLVCFIKRPFWYSTVTPRRFASQHSF